MTENSQTKPQREFGEPPCKQCGSLGPFRVGKAWNDKNYRRGTCMACDSRNNALRAKVRKYGVSGKEYVDLVIEQRGLCALCGNPPDDKGLVIDHNHLTGGRRALLCGNCNTGLGMFRDDDSLLERAARYLRGF